MFKKTRSASSSRENRETGRSKRVRRQGEDERNRARQKREPAHMCAQTHPKKHTFGSSCAFGPRGPGLSPGRSGRETRGAPGPRRGRAPPSPRPQSAASTIHVYPCDPTPFLRRGLPLTLPVAFPISLSGVTILICLYVASANALPLPPQCSVQWRTAGGQYRAAQYQMLCAMGQQLPCSCLLTPVTSQAASARGPLALLLSQCLAAPATLAQRVRSRSWRSIAPSSCCREVNPPCILALFALTWPFTELIL